MVYFLTMLFIVLSLVIGTKIIDQFRGGSDFFWGPFISLFFWFAVACCI
jgi:hypothetical protein